MRKKPLVACGLLVIALGGDGWSKVQLGDVRGTVHVKGKRDASGVVVYLENVPGTVAPPAQHAKIRQVDKQFDPPLTIVVRGATIDFPNEDKIFHNVFSVSRAARFDLGLYKSGTSKSVEMKRAGVVDVYCNIHPDMIAKVKILDNAFYATTDAAGSFAIPNVPEGEYPIVAWLPSGDQARGTAKITAGTATQVTLEVESKEHRETHTRKDGTPYGRYK